jgi:hypothetical protein
MHTHDTPAAPTHGRRQFLRLGGAGVVAAAVLAACTDDESSPPSETGVTEPATETTFAPPPTTSPEDGRIQDALVFRTARTMELAMVSVYDTLLGTGGDLVLADAVDYDEATRTTLELVGERHQAHADALVGMISEAGGDVVVEPNNGILRGVVEPQLADLTTERAVLQMAQALEDVAAGTYVWGTGTLTSGAFRADLMSIGGVTARQGAALAMLLDPTGAEATDGPLIDSSGPSRLPEHMFVGEGQDGADALTEPQPAAAENPEESAEEQEDAGAEEQDDDGPETLDSEPATTVPEG